MKKFKPERISECLQFLEQHKKAFGFGDWRINIKDETNKDTDNVAETDLTSWLDRVLIVTLYKDFATRKDWQETLVHELIHAAVRLASIEADEKTERLRYLEEEKFVNKFTEAYMELWRARK